MKTPKAHQSTPLPCPLPETSSGARYSCVPTHDRENAVTGSATNSARKVLALSVFLL
uniref:Uncharacterized protein n=1 Tax=Cajanus cajan TaxID=3821 RepID=A0A151TDK1_CAJCA|nr:hypothetical protein KK1_019721 [Cajanus cajan]